jgi:hypothetical protein
MVDFREIEKTLIAQEFSKEKNNEWFKLTAKKFINHVDTFYFTVDVNEKWNEKKVTKMLDYLRDYKVYAQLSKKPVQIFKEVNKDLTMHPFMRFAGFYIYQFGIIGDFDVFILDVQPNENTPCIIVQMRSQGLWYNGVQNSFDYVCDTLEKVLNLFQISIKSVKENRIDYAFHTNYIQNPISFFPEKDIARMQVSSFKDCNIHLHLKGDEVDKDYISFGSRRSSKVFIRVYNKAIEIIEMQEKSFFFALWLEQGLISKFDEWVYKRAYRYGTREAIHKARCEFYVYYGSNQELREELNVAINDSTTPALYFEKKAKELVPDVTTVINFEFQTLRSFYYSLKSVIQLKLEDSFVYREYMYSIFNQFASYINFLTSDTIRFVRHKGEYANTKKTKAPNADWWERLRHSKSYNGASDKDVKYFREYHRNNQYDRMTSAVLIKFARYCGMKSIPLDDEIVVNRSIAEEFASYITSLSDNDVMRFKREHPSVHPINEHLKIFYI